MNRRAGFTLIELLITITIMVVLVILSVVSLRSTQANARDEERKTDAEAIARGLELYYTNGAPQRSIKPGHYPGVDEVFHAYGYDKPTVGPQVIGGYFDTDFLPETPREALYLAGQPARALTIIDFWGTTPEDPTLINAEVTIGKYVYEPMKWDTATSQWDMCGGLDCNRFNLYYRTEKDNVIHKITSKHQ